MVHKPVVTEKSEPETAPATADEVVRLAARAFERDRYLAALLAPPPARQALFAIAAFGGEIGRIPVTVSEPMIGAIRLQWWRDAIEGMRVSGTRTGHPIADAIREAVRLHDLPTAPLIGFIDQCESGLDSFPPADDEALTLHMMKTEGALLELAAHVLGGPAAVERARPLAAPAQALGLTRLLVEFPALTAEGRTLLPATVLAEAGLTADDLYERGDRTVALVEPLLVRLADEAMRHLALARRQLRHNLMGREAVAFAPLAMVKPSIAAWRNGRDGIFARSVSSLPLGRVMRIAWTVRTGRV